MQWKKKNAKKMADMVNSVIASEEQIKVASMDGVAQKDIHAMAQKLMDTRMKIISGKTTCRDYMMKVLSKDQWKQLTDIIKA
jgi:ABC-type xylose transport system substrate-binding protein